MRAGLATARWIALVLPLTLMAGALGSQFIGGLHPCEMCHWQRWPHYAAIVAAGLAFVLPGRPIQLGLVLIAGLLIGISGAIGVFHAGVEYHWWPGITACTAALDPTRSIVEQIQSQAFVRCDLPQWTLFGISLAGFNALFSLAGMLAILVAAPWRDGRA